MARYDILSSGSQRLRRATPAMRRAWRRFGHIVSHYMPKRLYARSLIIVIAPMILLQSVVAFVFMERHWQTVTQRLSEALTRDIAAIIDLIETTDISQEEIIQIAQERLALRISIEPPEPLPPPGPKPFFSILDQTLGEEITRQLNRPFWLDTVGNSSIIEIRIQLEEDQGVLRVFARRSQAYASNTHIFLLWMVGTSLVLITIAVAFLRNQIRPILQLAEAAESFGKGQPTPSDFRPRGAEEVRRAGSAFLQMRERIERQIEQRTAMLTGVSHDLRTVLTRFKLQLALASTKEDKEALDDDIEEMRSMLEGYLAFARGEATEEQGRFDLDSCFQKLEEEAKLHECEITVSLKGDPKVFVRPNAFSRMIGNVVGNGFRYASRVAVDVRHGGGSLNITVDDNGPGIPAGRREDVFKPFVRLDQARNQDESGTGLGLSIARDIARGHGGDVVLDDSPLGGLRVIIRIPA